MEPSEIIFWTIERKLGCRGVRIAHRWVQREGKPPYTGGTELVDTLEKLRETFRCWNMSRYPAIKKMKQKILEVWI